MHVLLMGRCTEEEQVWGPSNRSSRPCLEVVVKNLCRTENRRASPSSLSFVLRGPHSDGARSSPRLSSPAQLGNPKRPCKFVVCCECATRGDNNRRLKYSS